jgi:hypothetical protein
MAKIRIILWALTLMLCACQFVGGPVASSAGLQLDAFSMYSSYKSLWPRYCTSSKHREGEPDEAPAMTDALGLARKCHVFDD